MRTLINLFVAGFLAFSMAFVLVNPNAIASTDDKKKADAKEKTITGTVMRAESVQDKQAKSVQDKQAKSVQDKQAKKDDKMDTEANREKMTEPKASLVIAVNKAEFGKKEKEGTTAQDKTETKAQGQTDDATTTMIEHYFIKSESDAKASELEKLIGQTVEITGTVTTDANGHHFITVKEFEKVSETKDTARKTSY